MKKVRKCKIKRQSNDSLNTCNVSSMKYFHNLPLNLDVLVLRKGNEGHSDIWTKEFKLLSIETKTYKVELTRGPIDFKSTIVKIYFIETLSNRAKDLEHIGALDENKISNEAAVPKKQANKTVASAPQ